MNRRHFVQRSMGGLGVALVAGAVPHTLIGADRASELVTRSSWAMGTSVSLSAPASLWARGLEAAPFGALARVDQLLSVHRRSSELSRLNRTAAWLDAGPELQKVASASVQLGEATDGALDVTVLPLMRAYGFLPGERSGELAELRRHIDFRGLSVDGSRVRIRSGSAVDFGGIAKGFGIDEAVSAARRAGLSAALVEAGGDLYAYGQPEASRDWKIGVRDPANARRLAATVSIHDEGIATSGSYLQRRMVRGKSIGHILDPRTGSSCDHIASATIIAPTAMEADALATAATVLPINQAMALIESRPSTEGLWILPDASVRMTPGMRDRATLR
jgi:FAD:protein FMN transferase